LEFATTYHEEKQLFATENNAMAASDPGDAMISRYLCYIGTEKNVNEY
jgi:hypothetical protein